MALLLSQPEAAAFEAATPEDIVKRLMEKYSLADLVTLAMQLTTTQQEHDYIQGAAQPVAGVGEASQKATIAHFLVQRVGVETVLKELNTP